MGAPAAPNGLSATGISGRNLLSLLLKFMSVEGCETVLDLANRIKLRRLAVQQLFDEAIQQKLVQAIGASSSLGLSIRYALTEMGRKCCEGSLRAKPLSRPCSRVPARLYGADRSTADR